MPPTAHCTVNKLRTHRTHSDALGFGNRDRDGPSMDPARRASRTRDEVLSGCSVIFYVSGQCRLVAGALVHLVSDILEVRDIQNPPLPPQMLSKAIDG